MAEKPGIFRATHSGDLKLGNTVIACAVLEDGTRVLWQQGFLRAIGRKGRAAESAVIDQSLQLPVFLRARNLKPFITDELIEASKPIIYRPIVPSRGGISFGYKAELLPQVCNVFLDALDDRKLLPNQQHIARQCKILIRGLAVVGITALVDEATGYQEVRDRLALQAILDKFLRKEFAKWAKRFPDEFYKEMFRLKSWEWQQLQGRRPRLVGYYTRDLVYDRLAPGLLAELEERNPKDETGHRKAKHHQWLTEEVGHPALERHLHAVMGFMRACTSWDQFHRMMQRAFPKMNTTLLLPMPDVEVED
jgi:P63C domain